MVSHVDCPRVSSRSSGQQLTREFGRLAAFSDSRLCTLYMQYNCVYCSVKILSVDKGFHIAGGTQVFGKFRSLKKCMKACAATPTCMAGDFNPWLHKCYQHSNLTACDRARSHPQFVHFSKVPCCKCFQAHVEVHVRLFSIYFNDCDYSSLTDNMFTAL